MADMLTTMSTENLTAAVTSLLQRPLPDTDQIQHSERESRRKQVKESSAKKQQTKKAKMTELSRKIPQTASNLSSHSQQAVSPNSDELSQKGLPQMQGQPVSRNASLHLDHVDSNKSTKSTNSKKKKASRVAKKKRHSKAKSNKPSKQIDKNILESNSSLQTYEQNHDTRNTFHESLSSYSSLDSNKNEMSRKLFELSRQVLNNQTEAQTGQSNFPGRLGSIYQENSSIQTMSLAPATSLTSVVVPSSSNPISSSSVGSNNIPVMMSPVSLPSGFHSPSNLSVSQSNAESDSQPVPTVSQADLSPQLPSFNSFSTPWVPQHLTDGMVPMLSLGPGLNIPLSVRPANPQLVSALLSRLPTILPKPDLTKSSAPSNPSQPGSTKSSTPSDISQPLVPSETAQCLTSTAPSPSTALSSSSPISSHYLTETMNTPCVSNLPLGDPTGMELQNLMNIVYGHLLDREQSGRTPTPASLMLESSFPRISTPYHSVTHPAQNTSQSEICLPLTSSASISQLGSDKGTADSYRTTSILKMAGSSQPSIESGAPSSHQQGLHHQSEVDVSQGEHPNDQPVAVNTNTTPGHQPGLIHQPVLHTLQPPPLTEYTNVQPAVHPYLTHDHHEPYDISHQSVISHTERLRHPEPAGRYQFNGQHSGSGPSTCMYMHHPDRQNDSQGLYHYNTTRNVDGRYRNPDYSESQDYDTSHTMHSDHCGQNYAAQQEYDTTPATDSHPEHVTTQEHTEEGSAAVEEREEESEIYCLDCNKMWKGQCQMHNTEYNHIEDTPVPSKAKASLPSCFYLKQTATSGYQSLGVWCKETVNSRTQFGPVVGTSDFEQRDNDIHFSPFKILHRNNKTETLKMTDENSCNWIMFVQLAKGMLEQNCVLYQQGKQLFIITKKELKKDTELLMWFSSDLCLQLKVSADPGVCKLVQCSSCGLNFLTKKSLHAHRRLKHPSEIKKSWSCSFCEKTYSSNTKLNAHLISHMGLKPHRCLYCNKEFTDHSNLKVHQYIHTGQKKYKCSTCSRTFRQKAHLNSHMLTHTGEKKIQCNFCDKQFARKSDCKIHEYQHTKERTYTCEVCKKVFFKTQTFKRHQKVHTGERNYMCNKCFKGFHTKYHRDRHLKICKEKGGKESTYMSLEEVANLDNTCDVVPLTVKAHEVAAENQSNHGDGERHFQNNMFST